MLRTRKWNSTVCILLSLLVLFDFVIYNPAPARALDKKSVAVGLGIGAALGVGGVLAAPAIGAAAAAAGAGMAGIGTAIVGGLAAASGAVIGAFGAVIGAIGAAGAAIGGWIAGLIASPLFIPALIVIGVCVAGYLAYRYFKKKNQDNTCQVLPEDSRIVVTPGDYDMNPVIPPMNQPGGVTISDDDGVTISGSDVTVSNTPPVSVGVDAGNTNTVVDGANVGTIDAPLNLKDAEARYKAAYNRYTKLATTGGQGDVQAALAEYKAAFEQYDTLKKASNSK
jgi:hypothetical protein